MTTFFSLLDGVSTHRKMWCSLQEKGEKKLSLWAVPGDESQVGRLMRWLGPSWYHFRILLCVAQLSPSPSSKSIFSCFHYRKWLALFSGLIRRGNMSCLPLGCLQVRVRKPILASQGCSVCFHRTWQGPEQRWDELFHTVIKRSQPLTERMASWHPSVSQMGPSTLQALACVKLAVRLAWLYCFSVLSM